MENKSTVNSCKQRINLISIFPRKISVSDLFEIFIPSSSHTLLLEFDYKSISNGHDLEL